MVQTVQVIAPRNDVRCDGFQRNEKGGPVMNEILFRPQFNRLESSEKLRLMQTLATRYNLTFRELCEFSRWGQSCTTGVF